MGWMRTIGKSFALSALVLAAVHGQASTARPLADALRELQRQGVNIVFSSRVVTPAMHVEREPVSRSPRARLEELLTPHSLMVVEGPGDVLIVVEQPAPPQAEPVESPPAVPPIWSEKIIVQPSRITLLLDDPVAPMTLAREEIDVIPHLGDDVFRTLTVLPGTTSTDVSAEVHVRGARRDELLIRLDGQELYEPWHLKDFDNVLSIVGATNLASVDLITAAFPASHGDRMGGVLDMITSRSAEQTIRVAANIHGLQIDANGGHRNGRVTWLASLRRGSTDLLGRALEVESPRFWDFFGKLGYEISPQQSAQLHTLVAHDRLIFSDAETKRLNTEYGNAYGWLAHQVVIGARGLARTHASVARLHRDRRGFEEDEERVFDVRDERTTHVLELRHSWIASIGPRASIEAGAQLQRFTTDYDYGSFRDWHTPLVAIRAEPHDGAFAVHDRFTGESLGTFLSSRLHPRDDLTLDAGLRYDRQSLPGDALLSPRVNAAWRFGASSVLRLAWGRFSQSQRSYELMVEDADVRVYPSERAQHAVLGIERLFPDGSALTSLRVETYRRLVSNPRTRYESLYKPFDAFPEGEVDRARISPESATAQGVEILLEGQPRGHMRWWLNYALARTSDRIDGREVPRRFDQTHTLKIDVNYPVASWNLNAAWLGHSGWPFTPLSVEDAAPVLGSQNSRRHGNYHRLDVRFSREWTRPNGSLSAYIDAHNVLARRNASGFDATLEENGELTIDTEYFPRFFASAGIVWSIHRLR